VSLVLPTGLNSMRTFMVGAFGLGSGLAGHLRQWDLAVPDVLGSGLRIADQAGREKGIEVGAADADPPADMQRGKLPLIDPVFQDTVTANRD
jgi:hypothetical protein